MGTRFRAKNLELLWVAIPFDWVILHRYACGEDERADVRAGGCTVTWLPKFRGCIDNQIFLPMARRYKMFHFDQFRADFTAERCHVARVFKDKDDILSGHGTSYSKILAIDMHAPSKGVKFRSQSSPWINNDIRRNMKLRFKLFKRAFSTKDQEIYARYKRVRDGITPEIRNAKAQYFKDKLAEVKTAVVY